MAGCVGGEDVWQRVCGGMHGRGCALKGDHGHAWQGVFAALGHACMAGEMATAVDSTHPTGMHSRCS